MFVFPGNNRYVLTSVDNKIETRGTVEDMKVLFWKIASTA